VTYDWNNYMRNTKIYSTFKIPLAEYPHGSNIKSSIVVPGIKSFMPTLWNETST
jgi:hypothetical protein